MSEGIPKSFWLKVITPRKLAVDDKVEAVSLPSLEGYLGILPGHRPLLVAVGRGRLSFRIAEKEREISVQGGYAEILPERVIVFTEMTEHDSEQSLEG
jgi:F-type H+-transporting ATPase subunit epsilon